MSGWGWFFFFFKSCDVVVMIVYGGEGLPGRADLFSSSLPSVVDGDDVQLLIHQHGLSVRVISPAALSRTTDGRSTIRRPGGSRIRSAFE